MKFCHEYLKIKSKHRPQTIDLQPYSQKSTFSGISKTSVLYPPRQEFELRLKVNHQMRRTLLIYYRFYQ